MSWGYVAAAGIMAVGGYMSAKEQASAAKNASNSQMSAANAQYALGEDALAAQLQMWNTARQEFADYLNGGKEGLLKMSQSLPNYVQNTLMPVAQQYAGYTPSALPNAGYTINPVTGQMTNLAQQGLGYTTPLGQQTGQTGQTGATYYAQPVQGRPAYNIPVSSGAPSSLASPAYLYQPNIPASGQSNIAETLKNAVSEWTTPSNTTAPGEQAYTQTQPAAVGPGTAAPVSGMAASQSYMYDPGLTETQRSDLTTTMANAGPGSIIRVGNRTYNVPSAPEYSLPMAQIQPQAQTNMPSLASQADLTQGGVLSPNVPTIAQALNYQFDPNDPVYQQKLKEKNAEIDKFLAKQGLQGSSAGESFRQEQINRLLAEEDARQYDRAKTERDYTTQTTAQQYGLEAARGDTLYNRLYGQAGDLYNRQLTGAQAFDASQLGALGRQYSVAQDVYGTLYGGALDQAKMGAGAAASAGSASMTTGQGLANTYANMGGAMQYAGNAAAQGYLAQGQANAGLYQSLGQIGGTLASQYLSTPSAYNYSTPQYYGYSNTPASASQSSINGLNYY